MQKVDFDKRIGKFSKVNMLDDLLCKAVQEGNFKTACRLIEQGASIEIIENDKEGPVVQENADELVVKKNGEIANGYRISIQGYTANPRCYESMPLCLAIEADDYEMTRMLLEAGADLSKAKNSFVYVAKEGYAQMVELLIKRGMDLSYNNYQALKYALASNRTEVIKVLISESYELSTEHYKALEYAAVNGEKELLKLLIDKGADLNDGYYSTRPLRFAIKCGKKEIVEILINSGAEITEKDFETAKECERYEIAGIIRNALDKKEK